MKKALLTILAVLLVLLSFSKASFVMADDEEFDDSQYCTVDGPYYDKQKCTEYLSTQSKEIKQIQDRIAEARKDLAEAQKLAAEYASQADALDAEINDISSRIEELQTRITELEISIAENEKLVEELNARVLNRMAESQKTMHFNPFLDFILGSNGFDDLLRRVYGVNAINGKDKSDRELLIEVIRKLNEDKAELDASKTELDVKKEELVTKQAQYIVMRNYWTEIQEETEAMIMEERNRLESVKQNYSQIVNNIPDISGLPSSEGFTSPVPGASISASVWHYPSSFANGATHLGVDYAVKVGTSIYAPINGVVIVSANGCPTYGYYGSSCAGAGGVSAGGNQVIMVGTAVDAYGNSQVYGVSFFHLQLDSPVSTGVIMQGDYVGKVGSSGNSTGAHCHIELYYLGPGDMSDIQADYLLRHYSLSFNCGWGNSGLNALCENGVGAPCRLNPTLYFGK